MTSGTLRFPPDGIDSSTQETLGRLSLLDVTKKPHFNSVLFVPQFECLKTITCFGGSKYFIKDKGQFTITYS